MWRGAFKIVEHNQMNTSFRNISLAYCLQKLRITKKIMSKKMSPKCMISVANHNKKVGVKFFEKLNLRSLHESETISIYLH